VSFTIYSMAMDTFVPLLGTLSTLLDKGAEHMKAKGLKPDTLTEARLAPDMFPLTRQVQIACDQVKSFVKGLMTIEDRMVSEIAIDRLLPDAEALAA